MKFPFLILRIPGCFSIVSVIARKNVFFVEHDYNIPGIFKSKTKFGKELLKIVHIFLPSEICFSCSLSIIFSPLYALFVKRGTPVFQKILFPVFLCIKAFKVRFFYFPQ